LRATDCKDAERIMNACGNARRALPVLTLAGLAALFAAGPCAAEIYGWVDASGQVTYSNLPPPDGVRVTDVIHDTPMSPKGLAEAAHQSEVSMLNDRIRLLELEMARSQRQVVDYPAPPPAPPGVACGPEDCAGDWGPFYTTGFLYAGPYRGFHDRYGYWGRRGTAGPRGAGRGAAGMGHTGHGSGGLR
jgi:hypothetical protein